MPIKSGIITGKYWNEGPMVVQGCEKVSPGCSNCWSLDMTKHYHNDDGYVENGEWTGKVTTHLDRLEAVCRGKKPKVISIWNDLFHKDAPFDFLVDAWSHMCWAKQHTFLVLTKRPERAALLVPAWKMSDFPHIWTGTTAETQPYADLRIPELLKVPGKKFLSLEPLLGLVNIDQYLRCPVCGYTPYDVGFHVDHRLCKGPGPGISWVICGPETGPKRRFCDPEWIRSIVEQCTAAGVPVWVKAMPVGLQEKPYTITTVSGGREMRTERWFSRISHDMNEFPEWARRREVPWESGTPTNRNW